MAVLEVNHVKKVYKTRMGTNSVTALKDVHFSVEEGEFVAICGESGKGKTTLLNIMGMIEKADKGDLYLFDKKNPDIRKPSGRKLLRTEMTYVFQNYGLVEDKTVQYNLNIASHFTDVTEKDIEEVLTKVGLDKNILKSKVYTLSGGEQQRVEFGIETIACPEMMNELSVVAFILLLVSFNEVHIIHYLLIP